MIFVIIQFQKRLIENNNNDILVVNTLYQCLYALLRNTKDYEDCYQQIIEIQETEQQVLLPHQTTLWRISVANKVQKFLKSKQNFPLIYGWFLFNTLFILGLFFHSPGFLRLSTHLIVERKKLCIFVALSIFTSSKLLKQGLQIVEQKKLVRQEDMIIEENEEDFLYRNCEAFDWDTASLLVTKGVNYLTSFRQKGIYESSLTIALQNNAPTALIHQMLVSGLHHLPLNKIPKKSCVHLACMNENVDASLLQIVCAKNEREVNLKVENKLPVQLLLETHRVYSRFSSARRKFHILFQHGANLRNSRSFFGIEIPANQNTNNEHVEVSAYQDFQKVQLFITLFSIYTASHGKSPRTTDCKLNTLPKDMLKLLKPMLFIE